MDNINQVISSIFMVIGVALAMLSIFVVVVTAVIYFGVIAVPIAAAAALAIGLRVGKHADW